MKLKKLGLYALSLPERSTRALAAALGGLTKLVTDTLLPRSLRKTSLYWYLVGNTQRYLIADLGQVRVAGKKLPDKYLLRKCLGNVAEAVGIVAFRFSPLWFFALVDDAAGGAKGFLRRVVAELKKEGVLERNAKISSAEHLLDTLSRAGAKSAAKMKFPPLSRKEISRLLGELGHRYADVYQASKDVLPSADVFWKRFVRVCRKEKVSFLRLSGAMALASAKAGGKATGDILYEKVVGSYARSLRTVQEKGFSAFFARETRPYMRALAKAYAVTNISSTEKLFR